MVGWGLLAHASRGHLRWRSILVWSHQQLLTFDLKRCLLFRKCLRWSSLNYRFIAKTEVVIKPITADLSRLWKCFSQQYHQRMVVGHAAPKLTKPASKHRFFLCNSTTPSRKRTRCGIQPWSKRFRQWWTQSRFRTKRLSEARDRSKVHHSVKGPRLTTAHFILDRPVSRTVAVAASS